MRSLYFKLFSAFLLITLLPPRIATSINMHVPFLLSRIMMSGLLLGIVLSVGTCWFHNMVPNFHDLFRLILVLGHTSVRSLILPLFPCIIIIIIIVIIIIIIIIINITNTFLLSRNNSIYIYITKITYIQSECIEVNILENQSAKASCKQIKSLKTEGNIFVRNRLCKPAKC